MNLFEFVLSHVILILYGISTLDKFICQNAKWAQVHHDLCFGFLWLQCICSFVELVFTASELVDIEILCEGTLGVISEIWILINVYIVKRTIF